MTKIGQPMKVNRSVVLPFIRCCPQYASVPYADAIQVGQSTTGFASSGKRLIKSQRSSSPIIPSAVDSHKPKMNIDVSNRVSIMGFGIKGFEFLSQLAPNSCTLRWGIRIRASQSLP
jgi:hypothetical protein